jgi:hypothetical protein
MSYSEFTLETACQAFGLVTDLTMDLFGAIPVARVNPLLRSILDYYTPMATSIHTEKARSEFIVAPILAEVRRLMNERISLFSGISFEVDKSQGLDGTCDFIFTASPNQMFLSRPAVMIVEAKNDNIKSGIGQCVAEMVAGRLFNQRQGEGPTILHGAVTTGSVWKFLRLEEDKIFIDRREYYLDQLDKLLGVLAHCVGGDPTTAGAAA